MGFIKGLSIYIFEMSGRVRSRDISRAICGLVDSDRWACDWLDCLDGLPNECKMCVADRFGVLSGTWIDREATPRFGTSTE